MEISLYPEGQDNKWKELWDVIIMAHASLSFPYMHTLSPNTHILGPCLKNHFIIIWTLSELVCVG